ncbi:NUDIX hydrolase [Paracoccus suum]|uniref:NUDIX hydrolase n=1 Tax=Paracoccus suum TaxID=2259340 RepID=A0A344PKC3_9RHOB|nr:NUDIX hydrolase [Paracoccus suum]AXC49828.1 NUDIX hydrolase [Paracoccus suum]
MRLRLAVRAAILDAWGRLLVVNAYPGAQSDLWCLPGGGVEADQSLSQNLSREVAEETGLSITVGAPILVNEFHSDAHGFRQVDLVFRATVIGDAIVRMGDPEGVVDRFRWVTQTELARLRHKPSSLADAVWGGGEALHDPDELIVA